MKNQVNSRLVAFAQEAKARGMTYGQLQAMETLAQIKAEKAKKEKRRENKGKGGRLPLQLS